MTSSRKRKYTQIRMGLLRKGLTLRQWAINKGYPLMTVYNAAKGERSGPNSRIIQRQLEAEIHG